MALFSSLSGLVKQFESGGNYVAVNPTSGAGGAYQFVPSTWRQYAGQIGVDTTLYPRAELAPPSVQDAVFQQAVAQRGLGDWTCRNCNAPLTTYVGANPDALNLPTFSNGSGDSGGSVGSGGSYLVPGSADTGGATPVTIPGEFTPLPQDSGTVTMDPFSPFASPGTGGFDPGAGGYVDPGFLSGSPLANPLGSAGAAQPQGAAGPLGRLMQVLADFGSRAALVLLGIVLIAAAAWAMAEGELPSPAKIAAKSLPLARTGVAA